MEVICAKPIDITVILSICGFIISLFLAGIRFSDYLRDRLNITISFLFTGSNDPDIIQVNSLGKRPLVITNFLIFTSKRRYFSKRTTLLDSSNEGDFFSIVVSSDKPWKLEIPDSRKFSFNRIEHKLFIGFKIAGKRKMVIKRIAV